MELVQFTHYDIKKIIPFWADSTDTLVWSALQGCMGTVWADDEEKPTASRIITNDFCFFTGEPHRLLVSRKPADYKSDFIIMVPENEDWADMIERQYGDGAKRVSRYAIRKEPEIFELPYLSRIIAGLNSKYQLHSIDEPLYHQIMNTLWAVDLCCNFPDYNSYAAHGVGMVITDNGVVVAGASTYSYYLQGIEIEIDTREDYRRLGLATVCGAALITECLKRGLYPSWDAQNKWSVSLAEKLGYHYDHEYTAYEITNF